MTHRSHQLAEFNIATMRFPLEDQRMRDFTESLNSVNAIADASPGFVWRLQSDEGDATSIRLNDDASLLLNLSVWESLDALRAFYLDAPHGQYLRRRAEWFEHARQPYVALWWVPSGHRPSAEEADKRLSMLREDGPTEGSFDFSHPFPMPGAVRHVTPPLDSG